MADGVSQSMPVSGQKDHEPRSVTDIIAAFVTGTDPQSIPDSTRHVAMLSMLDWIAVGRAGVDEPVSHIVRDMVAADGGTGEATVFGLADSLPARSAALANGTISHALDYDDTHFANMGHPSVAILPAAVATAEKLGCDGRQLIDAAIIGFETACRLGTWFGRQHYNVGFHQTATAGTFGATAAVARLLALDGAQTRYALGLAASRASGLKAQFGTMGKPFHAGMAASNGVECALLASAGFVSRPDALQADQGFVQTHSVAPSDTASVFAELGDTYRCEAVAHKFHACCHGIHATLEGLGKAIDQHAIEPERLESLLITVNPRFLDVCNIAEPKTGLEAKFSYRLTAALALAGRDTAALSTYSDATCVDPALTALRDRVVVDADPELADSAARLDIALTDGRQLIVEADIAAPIPACQRENRIRSKAAALLGAVEAERCWHAVTDLAQADFVTGFASCMRG